MAGGELRLGITWMNMHTQSATNRRRKQEHERDLHAYNPGARRPKSVRSHSLAPVASKKFGLAKADEISGSRARQHGFRAHGLLTTVRCHSGHFLARRSAD